MIEPNNLLFLFHSGKSKEDDLFDELDTSKLNAHLKELVPGLTAKVFRTYNASFTLDEQVCSQSCSLLMCIHISPFPLEFFTNYVLF